MITSMLCSLLITLCISYILLKSPFAISARSQSAYGEIVRGNRNTREKELTRDSVNVISLVDCNLRCLNDKDCEATNYLKTSTRNGGTCQLLKNHKENDVKYELDSLTVYTRLFKDGNNEDQGTHKDCDDGFSLHASTSTCIIAPSKSATWYKAQNECEKIGATLAKVDSWSKLKFITSLTKNSLYIGLKQVGKKQDESGSLFWTDGASVRRNKFINILRSECKETQKCCSILDYTPLARRATLKNYRFCLTPGYFVCQKKARSIN